MSDKNVRPRLSQEEYDIIVEYRERHKALNEECESKGIPLKDVNHYWYKGDNFSIHVKNNPVSYEDVRDKLIEDLEKHAPKYPVLKRAPITDGHLLVVDPADIHIGKLADSFETGEEYSSQIAVQRVMDGVDGILNKASGFNTDQILFIIGNDILHVDSPKRVTTSGTPQDTENMWYTNFLIAKQLYVDVIERLVTIADVHIQYDPSNHDYMSGFMLADTIKSWFSKSKNITFNVSPAHRKYYRYHSNLIGTTHGDGAKLPDLPLLMAQESSDWSDTKHRYVYTHHIHSKSSKDYGSVCVESLRSPSASDSWHHRNGYQHAPKAIEGFVHSKEHGQVARFSHIF